MGNKFHQQLAVFKNDLIKMTTICENMVKKVNELLTSGIGIEKLREKEYIVFDMGRDVENSGMEMLIRQQPVAKDLRLISSSFKIIYDCRRIATQVMEISESYESLEDRELIKKLKLQEMGELVLDSLRNSIDYLITGEENKVEKSQQLDDKVDQIFLEVKQDLVFNMENDKSKGGDYVNLLMVAKYYEKIGDHSQSIARNAYFNYKGEILEK